ncbi:LLM class flavin-dependent oxidoreductase [Altererythrobacter salegens]|uniref:LLM class flavin-dependent oxidoreductase n=1 Tax=Croceibacterium salegens TaxID=1737568 RepID=A0A6I4SWN3_9SPHN|nr:LLM class flavin-dependent oxidoreductase [Croceibacterium salegens]MXO60534.1 LLM class flavin-dependent oxidoreductase [Croceibacterium salegens]
MSRGMRFGIFDHIDANGTSAGEQYAQRLRLVELYERLGFYCYHLTEHHATELGMAPSPSVFLAAAAQRTSTIRLGSLVYLLPLHHPVRVLEEIGMLDHLSNGRIQVGIGRGGQPAEHTRYGLEVDDLAPMFEEAMDLVVEGLGGTIGAHKGKYYDLPDVDLRVRTVQKPHPPLWYGTASSHRNAWAARHDVNLLCLIPDTRARPVFDDYREELAKLGKTGDAIPFTGLARQLVVAPTDAVAIALGERAWKRFADSFNWLPRRLAMPEFPLAPTFGAAMESGMAFGGSPASVRDWVARSREDAGIDYMALEIGFGDMNQEEIAQSAELFAREVMPEFA